MLHVNSAKCCFGLTIFIKGFVAFLPINSQRAIFRAKNKFTKGVSSLTAQNIMGRAMSLVLTKSVMI